MYIYEITTTPQFIEDRLSANEIGYDKYDIGYIDDADDEERAEAIDGFFEKDWVNAMFERISPDAAVYKGGLDVYKRKWLERLMVEIRRLGLAPTERFDTYDLKRVLRTPFGFGSDDVVVLPDYFGAHIEDEDILFDFINTLRPGDKIYIGNVFSAS